MQQLRAVFGVLLVLALLSLPSLAPMAAQDNVGDDRTSVLQVVDSSPFAGEELGIRAAMTVFFDRELDCATAEAAARITPAVDGTFRCEGASITFTPSGEYTRATAYTFTFSDALRGADGAQLLEAVDLTLTSSGFLSVSSTLPTPDAAETVADTLLTIIFNRPVVPLGTPSDALDQPNPITIEPAIEGTGTWLNTSIYTFKPTVAWGGGMTYTVTVADVIALDGAPLQAPYSFSFTVARPEVLTALPENRSSGQSLKPKIQMVFNQPMDRNSVEASFRLRPENSPLETRIDGVFTWNEDETGFSFAPSANLALATTYVYGYPADRVKAAASDVTIGGFSSSFTTVPFPAVTGTDPVPETITRPYGYFVIFFASPMNPQTLRERVTIAPAPAIEPDFFWRNWDNGYSVRFIAEPGTRYTVRLAAGAEDIYGNAIAEPFEFAFFTGDYDPELNLQAPPGPVGFYDAGRETTGLFITHRNVSQVELRLYQVPLSDFTNGLTGSQTYNFNYNYSPRTQYLLRRWAIPSVAPANVLRYELLDLGSPSGQSDAPGSDVIGNAGAVVCEGAMPSRVKVGDQAKVIADPGPLRARLSPPDGEIIELLYIDYAFEIIAGPVCANNILWWNITLRDGTTAWVAEGLDDEYFIETTAAAPEAVTPAENRIQLDGGSLPPGIYFLNVSSPETLNLGYNDIRHIMVVGTANLVMKSSIDEVIVWVTDVRSSQPLPNVPLTLIGAGEAALSATTDAMGVARFAIPRLDDLYTNIMVVLDDGTHFGIGYSEWTDGIDAWRFNLSYNYYPSEYASYLYTERPVYRPGQPVYYRGVVRLKNDLEYTRPAFDIVSATIFDSNGSIVYNEILQLTEYGTFSGVFQLDPQAPIGYYSLSINYPLDSEAFETGTNIGFDVAEYRLPEYQVSVNPLQAQVVQNDTIQVEVDSRYFFGGPVANAEVEYFVSSSGYFFDYQGRGSYNFYDFTTEEGSSRPFYFYYDPFYGESVASGSGVTNGSGKFMIEVPAELARENTSATWTIEATVRDNSGQSVSGRNTVVVHNGLVYTGVAPEKYVGVAGNSQTLNIIAADWDSAGVAGQAITVEVVERRWASVQTLDNASGQITYDYEVEEIPVADGTVTTDENGQATFDFVPPVGGVYKAKVTTTDANGNVVTGSTFMWVTSANNEYVGWRIDNDNRIALIADRSQYSIGETANILITSPFQGEVDALVTVERGNVLTTERLTLTSNSATYQLPILDDYAPNVFVSVFIVKGVDEDNKVAAFRMGIVQLNVSRERKELTIELQPNVEFAQPGETVTYTVTTTNYLGEPVAAEVGVVLTDLASLSIGFPNSGSILDAFYSQQGLGVRTSSPLTINTDYYTQFVLDVIKGGGGGGGDGGIFEIREEFLDTAYWNATLETDENGQATFEVTLPDNLTTWRLDARGLTTGDDGVMLVGQKTFDLISTKPVLVRPVTPRFFVVGDQVALGAVVNNNTTEDQTVEVSIEATGVTLASDAAQTVTIAAGGSARVNWDVTVDDVENVELIFFANAGEGEYTDATRPAIGQGDDKLLPVYRYEAPEFVGTGGVLRQVGIRTERIVLPQRFAVSEADITVTLDQSLAGSTLNTLEALERYRYESVETTISRLLPNVMTYRALTQLGYQDEELQTRLDYLINLAIQRLAAQQKPDGGWGWYVQDQSNVLVTSWAVLGLAEARNAGIAIDDGMLENAIGFLQGSVSSRNAPGGERGTWLRDRQAIILHALSIAGEPDNAAMANLFDQRDLLSIYAKGLLTLSLDPNDTTRINALLDDIQSDAILSANGAHWEEDTRDPLGWNSDTRTTAIALSAMSYYRGNSDLLPSVVRWLMVARQGDTWETTQETAWAVMGLTDYMLATGELTPDYRFGAMLNGENLASGEATSDTVFDTLVSVVNAQQINNLEISRSAGAGALYYTAYLRTMLPVPKIEPINRGIIVQRAYYAADGDAPITQAKVGDVIQVRLTIIAPNDLYYLVVDDPLPAGTEGIDPGLATSQQTGTQPGLDTSDPLSYGWGWWWFSNIEFRDERVVLSATYLPAGTYEYVYSIRTGVPGTYNVIPPTAHEFYFPEVYGRGAGSAFTVLPE